MSNVNHEPIRVAVVGEVQAERIPDWTMDYGCQLLEKMIFRALEDPERRAEYEAFRAARAETA